MTTKLLKKVSRETVLEHRGRKLVISMLPGDLIEIREKGRQTREILTIGGAFDYAIITRVAHEKFAKKKNKK